MIVTILTQLDFGNSGYHLCEALKRDGVNVEIISLLKSKYNFNGAKTIHEYGIDNVIERLNYSDIIHWKGDDPPMDNFFGYFAIPNKPTVSLVGGTRFRNKEFDILEYKSDFNAALTPDLTKYNNFTWIPHSFNTFKNYFRKYDKLKIVHIPSNKDVKGTKIIREAIKILKQKRYDFKYYEYTDIDYYKSILYKKECNIYIDQVLIGSYGMSAVESMSFGIPTLAYIKDYPIDTPIIIPYDITPSAIANTLNEHLNFHNLEILSNKTLNYAKNIHGLAHEKWIMKYREVMMKHGLKSYQNHLKIDSNKNSIEENLIKYRIFITVIMNSYKESKKNFIRAVESVLANKNVKIQLILSTVKDDKCIKLAKDYPIDIVVNDKPGIYEQLNNAVKHIKGDFVTYFSSNDIMYHNKLHDEVRCLIDNNKKVCYSNYDIEKDNMKHTRTFYDYNYDKHLIENFVSDCAMINTKTFLKYMPFKTEYKNYAYYNLWLEIAENEGEDVFIHNNNSTWLYIITEDSKHQKRKKDKKEIERYEEHKRLVLNRKNIYNKIDDNRITQIHSSFGQFKEMIKKKYNLGEYINPHVSTLFMGMYNKKDYEALKNHKGKAKLLWCGSDGLKLKKFFTQYKDVLLKYEHIAMSKFLYDDLKEVGIDSTIIPICPTSIHSIHPNPRGENIYLYTSRFNGEFYGTQYIHEIKQRTGLNVIVTNHDTYTKDKLIEVYKSCFIGLRLTPHDGLPNTVIELGLMGRRCLYNGELPNAIKWKNIDDICESIMKEYNNRHLPDIYDVHDAVYNYLNIDFKFLYFKPIKIYTLLGRTPYLNNSSGDRINEINTYKALSKFADIYYNNQLLNFNDKKNYGTIVNSGIGKPEDIYDLYYIRNNEIIFNQIPHNKKKLYFCIPNHQKVFIKSDGLVYITKIWKNDMKEHKYVKKLYNKNDYIPNTKILFNQICFPKYLKQHPKTLEIKKQYNNNFIICLLGRLDKSNYPTKFLSILDELISYNPNITVLCNKQPKKIHNYITYIDRVDLQNMPYMINACNVIIYSQNEDGNFAGSLRVIEAMSYATPILTPKYAARIDELGEYYELYYDTPKEMLNMIKMLINNPNKEKEIGLKLFERAKLFNIETSALNYEKQIINLLNK